MKKNIALIVPTFPTGGGVPAVGKFLYHAIKEDENYNQEIISLSGHFKDSNNVRVTSPATWLRGIQITEDVHDGYSYTHYGSFFPEFPGQAFKPRKSLTHHLNQFDLIQIVAGSPAWAYLAKHVTVPTVLQVATLVKVERERKIKSRSGLRKLYQKYATEKITKLEKQGMKYVDHTFVENSWMYEYLQKEVGSDKVSFAPPGVDTQLYKPAVGGISEAPYILSVGRFSDPRKNTRMLFEAYKKLLDSNPDVPKLVLAGKSGPSAEDMEYARQVNISDHVEIKLDVSLDKLIKLYQGAELFLLSSDEEGFGMVIMEAMACGVPVIATDCGWPSTLITSGRDGYLVPVGSSESLAKRTNQLLIDNKKRQQFSESAREKILNQFSDEITGKKFLDIYNQLITK